jgi:EAL domain-containing protein (putative c-di-GMP-specific phosphodiesterase class I)
LLRWDHPALGSVPPSTFIPIAEETDVIIRVGEFVLEEACRQAMDWRAVGIDLSMAVNVSGRQLNDGGLPLQVATALAFSGLPAESLYLELTETLLMTDTLVTQRSIEQLHTLGVRLSIDDLGTGYSSLAYLHRFPVDELKINRSFISDLTSSAHPASLVAAMVAMGKALGLEIVAEGVETPEQAAQLRALGCDKAQGYLFARPQSPLAIAAPLERLPQPT